MKQINTVSAQIGFESPLPAITCQVVRLSFIWGYFNWLFWILVNYLSQIFNFANNIIYYRKYFECRSKTILIWMPSAWEAEWLVDFVYLLKFISVSAHINKRLCAYFVNILNNLYTITATRILKKILLKLATEWRGKHIYNSYVHMWYK